MFDKIREWSENAKIEIAMKKQDAKFFKEDMKSFPWKTILFGILIVPILLWALVAWSLATDELVKVTTKGSKTIDTVIVQKKDPTGKLVSVSQNIDRNFVYTDRGAFVYEPTWIYLQEEVANDYGAIEEDTYYVLTHYGVRFSFFKWIHWYENIIDYRKPTPEELRDYLRNDPQALLEFEDKMKRIENMKISVQE